MVCGVEAREERAVLRELPEDELGGVIRALRNPGDEVELTRAIHAFARSDQRFAVGFGSLVLAEARRPKRSGSNPERAVTIRAPDGRGRGYVRLSRDPGIAEVSDPELGGSP